MKTNGETIMNFFYGNISGFKQLITSILKSDLWKLLNTALKTLVGEPPYFFRQAGQMVAKQTVILPTNKCHKNAHADHQEMSTATAWPAELIPRVKQHTLHALLCSILFFSLSHVFWIFQGPQDTKGFTNRIIPVITT